MKILIGSPIRENSNILKEFLLGLEEIDCCGIHLDYFFVDDNNDEKSRKLLLQFSKLHHTIVLNGSNIYKSIDIEYLKDKNSHFWKDELIKKVAHYKNYIIEYATNNEYDYLFLIDSDIVLDHRSLKKLISDNVDIVSNVFWTQWRPNISLYPQCFDLNISDLDENPRKNEFNLIYQLRLPGLYEVRGTGACTLISKKALESGVSFKKITNIDMWGEDRDFCVRANVLGFKLYVDTTYPAYHIYREEYVNRVDEFKRDGFKFDMCQTFVKEKKDFIFKKLIRCTLKYFRQICAIFKDKRIKNLSTNYYKQSLKQKGVLFIILNNHGNVHNIKTVIMRTYDISNHYFIINQTSNNVDNEIDNLLLKENKFTIINDVNKNLGMKKIYKEKKSYIKKLSPEWVFFINDSISFDDESVLNLTSLLREKKVGIYSFAIKESEADENSYIKMYQPSLIRYSSKYRYKWNNSNLSRIQMPSNIGFLKNVNIDSFIIHFDIDH